MSLRIRTLGLAMAGVLASVGVIVGVPALGSPLQPRPAETESPAPGNWPEMHGNQYLTGYSPTATVTDTNAATLGVGWALNLYSPALASPVVGYDAARRTSLVYQGTDAGDVFAVDTATGHIVWSTYLGSAVRDTPLVSSGSLWVGTTGDARIYKLNASTGSVECSLFTGQIIYASPVAATPPGGVPSVYFGSIWRPGATGFVMGVKASNCAMEWKFTRFPTAVAVWDSLSYVVDRGGHGRVLFGTSNPDQSVYELSAVSGGEIWRHKTTTAHGDYDVGSGVTISPPGANGFADGVAYVPVKNGFVYALDLMTGHVLWQFNMNKDAGVIEESLSTAALDGTNLVLGCTTGIYDLNAVTGKKIWSYTVPGTTTEVISSPAISGPPGHEVVSFGDVGDYFRVLSLATGKQLYHFRTASWIAAGPALSQDNVLISSNGGYLYDFRPHGGNSAAPTTTVSSPPDGAIVPNPNGNLTLTGTASDAAAGVGQVLIGVRGGGTTGSWWDAVDGTWHVAPVVNYATLSKPGGSSTRWSFRFPAAASGSTYVVQVNAASTDGVPDVKGYGEHFFVRPTARSPTLAVSEQYIEPATGFYISGKGFEAGEQIELTITGSVLARSRARSDGSFLALVGMPSQSVLGPASILATGLSSKRESSVPIYIAESWPELGSDPSRTGYEANDGIIDDSIDPAQNVLLDLAWHFSTGAGLATAPAIVDDVAYIGNGAGKLFAIRVSDGRPLWSWRTPTHKSISGAPAVDAATGDVYVGATDGRLYAVSTSGHLRWSSSLGGSVLAPDLSGSDVYAASTSGRVAGFAATGARLWSVAAGGAVGTSPALDTHYNSLLVTVPVAGGTHIVALNASTGARRWISGVSGSVRSSPSVSAGISYVGSTDHFVYATDDANGARVWSYATGGAVEASPAIALDRVVVGADNGAMYVIYARSGQLIVTLPMGLAARGVISSGATAIEVGSNGETGGIRVSGDIVWGYATGKSFAVRPAASSGAFYAATTSGELLAFTPAGLPPI